MKQTLSFIMAIIMLAALCACGQSNSAEESAAPAQNDVASAPETQKPDEAQNAALQESRPIGVITDSEDLNRDDLEDLLRECGVDLSMYGGYMLKYISQPGEALDAANDFLKKGCGTILFAAAGTVEMAAQFADNQSSAEVLIHAISEESPVTNDTAEIEWTNATFTITDSDGYTYEISYKLSPWILLSNEEVINSAWDTVGHGKSLPDFDDWGLKWDGKVYWRPNDIPRGSTTEFWNYPMSDMYYCVGEVSVRNTTEGWDISTSNKRSVEAVLGWKSGSAIPEIQHTSIGAYTIGRTFYSSQTEDQADCIRIHPSMTSNTWGPNPFVLMAPENFSPKYPDGQFYEHTKTGALSFLKGRSFGGAELSITEDDIRIGIIGKSGEYIPPAE